MADNAASRARARRSRSWWEASSEIGARDAYEGYKSEVDALASGVCDISRVLDLVP